MFFFLLFLKKSYSGIKIKAGHSPNVNHGLKIQKLKIKELWENFILIKKKKRGGGKALCKLHILSYSLRNLDTGSVTWVFRTEPSAVCNCISVSKLQDSIKILQFETVQNVVILIDC